MKHYDRYALRVVAGTAPQRQIGPRLAADIDLQRARNAYKIGLVESEVGKEDLVRAIDGLGAG